MRAEPRRALAPSRWHSQHHDCFFLVLSTQPLSVANVARYEGGYYFV
jgi:hypothetical protein